jgi:hypothetical protein
MNHAPEFADELDVLSEFAESGHRSIEAFAAELDVPPEWVHYWLELAELRRRQRATGHQCD